MREPQDNSCGLGVFRNTDVFKECAGLIGGRGGENKMDATRSVSEK